MRVTKKTRQTWIIGKYAADAKELHFPPVVPWIDNDLQGQLVNLFTSGIDGDLGAAGRKIEALERQIEGLRGHVYLSPVQKRQMHKAKKELEELQAQQAGNRAKDKARSEVLMLSLIRGIRQVRVQDHQNRTWAIFITAPVVIRQVVLGTYDIWFDPTKTVPRDAFHLRRRDYRYEQGPHPHWMGYGCFGTFGPIFQRMLTRHDYGSLIGAFLKYLAIYDPNSPLVRLKEFTTRSYSNENPLA
jgi:hypothetical protein